MTQLDPERTISSFSSSFSIANKEGKEGSGGEPTLDTYSATLLSRTLSEEIDCRAALALGEWVI